MSCAVLSFQGAGFAFSGGPDGRAAAPVLSDVSFEVGAGEVVLLVGPSGCGKSTLLKMANGLIPHYVPGYQYGQVLLEGVPVGEMPLHEVSRKVGSVSQNPRTQMFNVEVRAELAFACENLGVEPEVIEAVIDKVAREFEAEHLLGRTVFDLSGGERQKVACMCASVLDAHAIVLDEPSSNLDIRAVRELERIIERWKKAGKAVIVAEHRLYYLRDLADKVIHIDAGHVRHVWSGEQFRAFDDRATSELGLRSIRPQRCDPCACQEPQSYARAHIEGLACSYGKGKAARVCLDIPSLELPLGIPIALIGENGAGKSTFLRSLCGLAKNAAGTCSLADGRGMGARERLRLSYLVMQDVTSQLFCASVAEEVSLSAEGAARMKARTCADVSIEGVLEELDLTEYADSHPLALSGGQQQRVSVACARAAGRAVVLFDEPTSGLDVAHMREVAALIQRVAAHGADSKDGHLVVVATHDYEFICACCGFAIRLEAGRAVQAYSLADEYGRGQLYEFFWGGVRAP